MHKRFSKTLMVAATAMAFAMPATAKETSDFDLRRASLSDRACFSIFDADTLSGDRLDYLKFLYSYLPQSDISTYSPEFFLANVDASLKAREEMPWGASVPEREFRHFVLPIRVNNENLDSARMIFYGELKDRVKGLSMEEAILEVNHWCHEKVTYQPSDPRTSNPLSTVSQAIGRCGEESTFTVAALRAVGIPARQVYTPRWAHTDNNHAWVEAWANGKWYFLGACEPEPILNLAWFNAPATRGMLMSTNVFGKYDGPEEKLDETDVTTRINVTENYAPTGLLKVKVTDKDGNPVKDAAVRFGIYNYCEFYPVASRVSGSNGEAELICGLGDMVVWATDGDNFGFVTAHPEEGLVWTLKMDKNKDFRGGFEMTVVPPVPGGALPKVSDEMVAANARRLAYEDSVRKAYVATFISADKAREMASAHGWDAGKTADIFPKSRGNHSTLHYFLENLDGDALTRGFNLLGALSEKDLRDVTLEVLLDNIQNTPEGGAEGEIFTNFVLSPRVEFEPLQPYKTFFRANIPEAMQEAVRENPETWVDWVRENITVDSRWNPQGVVISPLSVWNQKAADARSLAIFFVTSMRSMGMPSRVDFVTGKTQYYADGAWVDVKFEDGDTPKAVGKGSLALSFDPENRIKKPAYYSHYAVHKIENGAPTLLEFDEMATLDDVNAELSSLDEGQYMTITAQRLADGSVLVKGDLFNVAPGDKVEKQLTIRRDDSKVSVIGTLDAEHLYRDLATGAEKSILSTTGRGNYILGIIRPNHEPSEHSLNDLIQRAEDLEKRDEKIVVLFRNDEDASRFDKSRFEGLPSNISFGVDTTGGVIAELIDSLSLPDDTLPIFVIADSFNRVMYVVQGYTIGLGDKLIETLNKM